jgi:DNA polymerase-3 subunit epsilon
MSPRSPRASVLDIRTPVRYAVDLPSSPTPAQLFGEPVQTALGDAVPLGELTFVVVDLETTGGSPVDDTITEIGAVRFEGAERVGSFQTLVDPMRPIPPYVAHLTGITDRMVAGAPPLQQVIPAFLEFARGAVIVAHNASFDVGFLNATLLRLDYPPLPGPQICTAKLARRLVWPDVPNVKLGTLAAYFRTRVRPTHRALDDAEATGEIFQGLLDIGAHLGIHTLGELSHACSARGRPNFAKIALAEGLPRGPGVYLFRDRNGQVLYVGKAKDLRARVKSYFYGDERKKVQDLVASVASIDTVPARSELEALVVEIRLIAAHMPRFNAQGKRWRRFAYLKLDPSEAWPRLKIARAIDHGDGAAYLGPFPTSGRARLAKEAIEEAFPLRRCTRAMGRRTRFAPCALADMGRCLAPCDDRTTPEGYRTMIDEVLAAFGSPRAMLHTLVGRMESLAEQERFEEATLARDRLQALADALSRMRLDRWLTSGRLVLDGPTGPVALDRGSLEQQPGGPAEAAPIGWPPPRDRADELAIVRSFVRRHPMRVLDCEQAPAEPVDGGAELAELLARIRAGDDATVRRWTPRSERSRGNRAAASRR